MLHQMWITCEAPQLLAILIAILVGGPKNLLASTAVQALATHACKPMLTLPKLYSYGVHFQASFQQHCPALLHSALHQTAPSKQPSRAWADS